MNETTPGSVEDDAMQKAYEHIAEDRSAFVGAQPDSAEQRAAEYDTALDAIEDARLERIAGTTDITRTDVRLPQLPESGAHEVYERIDAAERLLISPNLQTSEYGEGQAQHDDELAVMEGGRPMLITADHATDPVRKATGIREGADHGTGGLAQVLHEDTDSTSIIPIGKQTGNAAVNPEYPLKEAMKLYLPDAKGFLSVHGMIPGKTEEVFGRREVQAILGLGSEPNDMSYEVARLLREYAKDLGIKMQIANDEKYLLITGMPATLRRDEAGQPIRRSLAAKGDGTTTNLANRFMTEQGQPRPAMQIEMTRMLRVLPEELERRDVRSRVYGVYCGYLLTRKAVELMTGAR